MYNGPCISCKKPMNGGVYRKPNECPHCSALQDTGLLAEGKTQKPAVQPSPARSTKDPERPPVLEKPKPKPKQQNNSNDDELAAALAAHRARVAAKRRQGSSVTNTTETAQKKPKSPSASPGAHTRKIGTQRTEAQKAVPTQPKVAKRPNQDENTSNKVRPAAPQARKTAPQKQPDKPTGNNDARTRASIALAAINKVVEAEKKRSK